MDEKQFIAVFDYRPKFLFTLLQLFFCLFALTYIPDKASKPDGLTFRVLPQGG